MNPSVLERDSASGQSRSGIEDLLRYGSFLYLFPYSGVEALWRISGWFLPILVGGSVGVSPIGLYTDFLAGVECVFLDDGGNRLGVRAVANAGAAYGVGSCYDVGVRTELSWLVRMGESSGMVFTGGLQARFGYPAFRLSVPIGIAFGF